MKQACLRQIEPTAAKLVRYVTIDFNRQTLSEALRSAALDLTKPTFFLWEGVTQYLTAEAVEATFCFVATAPPGSKVLPASCQAISAGTGSGCSLT